MSQRIRKRALTRPLFYVMLRIVRRAAVHRRPALPLPAGPILSRQEMVMSSLCADPSAFSFAGGPVGCLLIHGFTGSPAEMRPLGEYLHAKGLTVSAPLLPGHGGRPDDLNQVTWRDWVAAAEGAFAALTASCETIFVAGLSMGAVLACHLAAEHPECGGLLLYAPALRVRNHLLPLTPLLRRVVRQFPVGESSDLVDPEAPSRLWHYPTYPVGGAAEFLTLQRRVRRMLQRIQAPTLIFVSTRDASVPSDVAPLLCKRLGASDRAVVTLHNSGHCMLVDAEREMILARSYGFIQAHRPTV